MSGADKERPCFLWRVFFTLESPYGIRRRNDYFVGVRESGLFDYGLAIDELAARMY